MMDMQNLVRVVLTVVGFLLFVGFCFWAYSSGSKAGFDEAAQQPLLDDDLPSSDKLS